jgi:hypothetical protein
MLLRFPVREAVGSRPWCPTRCLLLRTGASGSKIPAVHLRAWRSFFQILYQLNIICTYRFVCFAKQILYHAHNLLLEKNYAYIFAFQEKNNLHRRYEKNYVHNSSLRKKLFT